MWLSTILASLFRHFDCISSKHCGIIKLFNLRYWWYQMKVIPDMCRAHLIWYLCFYSYWLPLNMNFMLDHILKHKREQNLPCKNGYQPCLRFGKQPKCCIIPGSWILLSNQVSTDRVNRSNIIEQTLFTQTTTDRSHCQVIY